MEVIIQKYKYVGGTEEEEYQLQEDLNVQEQKIAEEMDLATLKKVMAALSKKICVKDYAPRSSPPCRMAIRTIRAINNAVGKCMLSGKLTKADCQDVAYEFFLSSMRTGPGTGHTEIAAAILEMPQLDMINEYLNELRGPKFKSLMDVLKGFTYSPESGGITVKDQSEFWSRFVRRVIQESLGETGGPKPWEPEIHEELLDLFLFYFLQMDVVPVEYIPMMDLCMTSIEHGYRKDRQKNIYADVNLGIMRKHLSVLEKLVRAIGFPKHEKQLDQTRHIMERMLAIVITDEKLLLDLWEELINFLKTLVLCVNSSELVPVINTFGNFYRKIPETILQNNPKFIACWSPVFAETVEKGDTSLVKEFAENAAYRFAEKCKPVKGDIVVWMPVFRALMKHPIKDIVKVVAYGLSEGKFKKIWEWKKNWEQGKELINLILKVNLPEDEGKGYWDHRDIIEEYAKIAKTLLEQFNILKICDKISWDAMEVCISLMERRSEIINKFPREVLGTIPPLEKHRDKIPGLASRLEALLLDSDYPWISGATDYSGLEILEKIFDSYNSGTDIQDEVNQSIIRMISYCFEGDVEYINMDDGNPTIYCALLQLGLMKFITLHNKKATRDALKPLMPLVLNLLGNEEELLQDIGTNCMLLIGHTGTSLLAGQVDKVVKWYKAKKDSSALSTLFAMFKYLEKDSLKCDFQEFFYACTEDRNNMTMQITVLHEVAQKTPEVFSSDNIKSLLTVHLNDPQMNMMVLRILDFVAADYADRFPFELTIQRIFHDIHFEEECYVSFSGLVTNLGSLQESYADVVLEEIIVLSRKSRKPMYGIMLLNSLKTLIDKFGKYKLEKHRPYFENLKKSGETSDIKEAASHIINFLDGRSLETVAEDVQQNKKGIAVLDQNVKSNTKEVTGVKTQVEKNTKGVALVKGSLHGVNERVDKVEDDLDEAKVKVEEIDNKTMTNAPAWSRDVTKLMNPQAEHDWRLLASRLGYSNDDIRGWATQHDPCMALLSEWYATHKTIEATHAVLTALQEMNREDAAAIVENAMKNVKGIVEEAPDYATPPPIFLSYQWGHQEEVKLLRNHLQMAGYECWMDIGQMGGGDKLFEKIDNGIRGAKVIISCVSEKYAKSPNCNREVNLSVNLGKPIIPLLMEKMDWPPRGSMGPIFSEYLFVRFFQRAGEDTKDQRYWPVPKFQELLMQINLERPPDDTLVTKEYKEWWKPMIEEIVIVKKDSKGLGSSSQAQTNKEEETSPDVFISYQWGKQPQIKQLYKRLTELGFSCWMDIYQMGGGDSLYDKIDRGVRGCKVVLSCVTSKYSLSANCRREVSLADSLKKPLIPLLMEKIDWPPTGPMSMVFTQLLYINFHQDEKIQMTWKGKKFDELLGKISENGVGDCVVILDANANKKNESNSTETHKPETADKVPQAKKSTTPEPKKSSACRIL